MKRRICINQQGYTLAGALCLLAIMAILMAASIPLWSKLKQRDNEEELIFRGNEYVEAIARYHAKFGSYPPDLETLVKLKFLRHDYADPMTKSGKWKVLHPDALVQTGAAGTINTPGTNPNGTSANNNNSRDGDDDEDGGTGINSSDDDDDNENEDQTPGLSDEDDENSDEEKEVESTGPVVGVVSRSKKASFKIYNGQSTYNKWTFVYALPQQQQQRQGGAPRPAPGTPGQPGQPGTPGQPGGVVTPGIKPPPTGGQQPPPVQPPPIPDNDDNDNSDNGDPEKE